MHVSSRMLEDNSPLYLDTAASAAMYTMRIAPVLRSGCLHHAERGDAAAAHQEDWGVEVAQERLSSSCSADGCAPASKS